MTNQPSGDEIRPFATTLLELSGGRTHEELTHGLHDLVTRVKDTGKKGTITVKITVNLLDGNPDVLVLADEIALKLPEHDRPRSIFYADRNANLTRNDPNQLTLDDVAALPAGHNIDPALRDD